MVTRSRILLLLMVLGVGAVFLLSESGHGVKALTQSAGIVFIAMICLLEFIGLTAPGRRVGYRKGAVVASPDGRREMLLALTFMILGLGAAMGSIVILLKSEGSLGTTWGQVVLGLGIITGAACMVTALRRLLQLDGRFGAS